jgi:hypothetical protein
MNWTQRVGVVLGALVLTAGTAFPVAQQIGGGDTALLFGGTDAQGGIGDWYLSNGTIEAIVDDVGIQSDLTGIVPPGDEPPIQNLINPTGGSVIDLGRVGTDSDQLPQLFTVGGLSTTNFLTYDTISAPDANTIRVTGGILFPPTSVAPSPCLDVVTDYQALGSDPYLTITSVATNNCGVNLTGFAGLLDVFIWGNRSVSPFSGAGFPAGGGAKGFDHPTLDLVNPVLSLELPVFMGGPGVLDPADGITDPTNSTTAGEVSYGLIGVSITRDPDGPGGAGPDINAAVNNLFGINGPLVTALGNNVTLVPGGVPAGGTLTYVRRVYVGDRNDVRSVSNPIFTEFATRTLANPVVNGTVSGDVDAADTASVEATLLITRLGRCSVTTLPCKATADCAPANTCVDPFPTTGHFPNGKTSQIRTDSTGAFSGVVLPRGDYEFVVASAERDNVTVSPVVVAAAANTPVVVPPLSSRGTVAFTVNEKTGGLPLIPARLTFKGVTPTPDPVLNKDFSAMNGPNNLPTETFGAGQAGSAGSAAGQGNVVYTGTGSGSIQMRPGTYDVYASRGMEYSVDMQTITVNAGATTNVGFRIKRSVKTKDAISADFHIHSGRSFDTDAGVRDRVISFAGEGVEVMVSTDHDEHTDYAPLISSLGLDTQMSSMVGIEVTGEVPNPPALPESVGHLNAWPQPLLPNARRDGAIEDELIAPNWIYSRLRDQGGPDTVIQYNHVRAGVEGLTSIGFFNNIGCGRCENAINTLCTVDTDCPALPTPQNCTCVGYQPTLSIATPPNDILLDDGVLGPGSAANPDGFTNLDFDVLEVENSTKAGDYPTNRRVRFDWYSLLQQGIYKPATGTSDSHRITVEHAGWARSYVVGLGDDPTTIDPMIFNAAVKAGNMLVSGGPYIELVGQCGPTKVAMGELLNCPSGTQVKLKVKVRTPAWMPIEEVRVVANGAVVSSFDSTTSPKVRATPSNFESNGGTMRFRKTLKFTPTVDTYYVIEAGPKLPPSISTLPTVPPIVAIVQPDVVPGSMTNPIFVDTNNNAAFDPPGLPVILTASADEAPGGFWQRITGQLWNVASRFTGEAIAQGGTGEMTGVTEEQKHEAIRKGEYFPIHKFAIPEDAAAEAARKAAEAEQKAVEQSTGASDAQK